MSENIKIGDRMKIQLKRDDFNEKAHISQIEDILDDRHFVAHVPISYGQKVELPTDTTYKMLFFTERGIISFNGMIDKYEMKDDFAVMYINLTSDGERVQRRDFFRFSCVLPMKFSVVDEIEGDDKSKSELFQGIVKDVGGGGVRFLSNANIDENVSVKCIIKLDEHYLVAVGEVLQKYHFPKSNYRYQYRVGFAKILPSEQEKIVQFIFNEQKKRLQRMQH